VGLGADGGPGANGIVLFPFCLGADNATFSIKLIGWKQIGTGAAKRWFAFTLFEYDCTAGSLAGESGQSLASGERLADTLTKVLGGSAVQEISAADNMAAHIVGDLKGAQWVEPLVKVGTATSVNAFFSFI